MDIRAIFDLAQRCKRYKQEIYQQNVEWHRLASFIEKNYPDFRIEMDADGDVEAPADTAIRLLTLQPCGHPRACVRVGEEKAPGQFVHVCGWCESLEVARWQAAKDERERLGHVLLEQGLWTDEMSEFVLERMT